MRSSSVESQTASRRTRRRACRGPANFRTTLAVMPASASAPETALNSFGIEPVLAGDDETAGTVGTVAIAEAPAVGGFGGVLAAGSLDSGWGLTAEATLEDSGQRERTTDRSADRAGTTGGQLFSLAAVSAGVSVPLNEGGAMLACGGSSACASSTERCDGGSAFGSTGFAERAAFGTAVCES